MKFSFERRFNSGAQKVTTEYSRRKQAEQLLEDEQRARAES
jgi:hypothetical protein